MAPPQPYPSQSNEAAGSHPRTDGIYLAVLTNAQGYQNYVRFVVRDDARLASHLARHKSSATTASLLLVTEPDW